MECVILAAGSSSRLGMDKALVDVGSQTAHQLDFTKIIESCGKYHHSCK